MKLIFIHGRAQGGYDPTYLKKLWTNTLITGLEKSNLTLPNDLEIEFPYYGDLLDQLVKEAKSKKSTIDDVRSNDFQFDGEEEIEFFQEYLAEIAEEADLTLTEQAEINEILDKSRGFGNWKTVQKALVFLDQKGILGDFVIKKATKDVFAYLTISSIREQVHECVKKSFNDTPCVVVGHSLGSVVSYLILVENPQYQVKKLVTLGSPLGVRSLQKHFSEPIAIPSCIQSKEWFNAYDDRDYVALNPLDSQYFNVFPPITNKRDVDNQTPNRHGIDGYLNDPIVAKTIYDALISIT